MSRRTQLMDPTSRELAQELTTLRQDVDTLKANFRAAQLGHSTIEGGTIQINDRLGNPRGSVGMQPDGTFAQVAYAGTPPPQPNTPIVSGFPAGINIKWDGQFLTGTRPLDFSHVEVHVSTTSNFIPSSSTFVGVLGNEGVLPHAPLDSGTTYYARLRAMSTSLVPSTPSVQASGSPQQVVAQAVLDGIVTETALAANAVSEAKLAAGAVTNTKIADNAVSSPKIIAGGIQAGNLAVGAVQAGTIAASAVTAEKIAALAITGDKIAANAVTAGKIAAGSIQATHLQADLVLTTNLIAGNPTGARIVINTTGIEGFRANGTRVLDFDNATGDMTIAGRYRSADTGSRIEINPGGVVPDEMRFYQGNQYAYLNAENTSNNQAALRGRSQVVNSRFGNFGCYPFEAYVAHTVSGGVGSSAFSCTASTAAAWAYAVNIVRTRSSTAVPSDGGIHRTAFYEQTQPYSTAIPATVIEFKTKTANGTEPMIVAPSRGSGMVFGLGHLYFTDGAGNGAIVVHASQFFVESGIDSKKDIKELGFKAKDKIKFAKVKKWKRPGDQPKRRPKVALPMRQTAPGEPEAPIEWIDPPPAPPEIEHIGPMAEDMPAEVLAYDPEYPNKPGISLSSYISLVHAAVGDLIEDIEALTAKVSALEAKAPKP